MMKPPPKIRVLIVDDSAVMRTTLNKLLSMDKEIEVIATAPDPLVARDKLVELRPDVMTLDLDMPKMDGVTFLTKVMQYLPTRTLVISGFSSAGSKVAMDALAAGAIDVMAKPEIQGVSSLREASEELATRVKAVARAKLRTNERSSIKTSPPRAVNLSSDCGERILAIASSTGGTEALKVVLPALPSNIPPIVIVQHMPPVFTKSFADHLSQLCSFEVKEAEDGDLLQQGRVLIAPGNFHMELRRRGSKILVLLHQKPLLHGVRPAADYLFNSVAQHIGAAAVGIVLTGMGKDGAAGLLAMRQKGSVVFAQDEHSSVVFGMPKAAIDAGAVTSVLPLGSIAPALIDFLNTNRLKTAS